MAYRDIRIANCEDAAKRVFEARRHRDEKGVRTAQVQLGQTLEAIKDTSPALYAQYLPLMNDVEKP